MTLTTDPKLVGLRFTLARAFDRVRERYESTASRKAISSLLLGSFIVALAVIELGRQGIVPEPVRSWLPTKHFVAVEWTVDALLVFELIELILGLARSVAGSLAIQLEIFALILLRKSFEELKHFDEPIDLHNLASLFDGSPEALAITNMGADALGALVVFGGLVVFRSLQKHRPITLSKDEQHRFVAGKKVVALAMLIGAVGLAGTELQHWVRGTHEVHFFGSVFTGLIFTDIAIVLISLRYSRSFPVVFRNFGFTVVTVFLRLAITAPPMIRALLGLFVLSFAVAVAWLYNQAHSVQPPSPPGSSPSNTPTSKAEG